MYDCFNRKINYLRISVTDRCNLRCSYCMPEEGVTMLNHTDIISFEEIVEVVTAGVSLGIDKIRITGGEPLVRKGIVDLVGMLSAIRGIRDLSMTTNGQLLAEFAKPLAEAGLMRINVSLDTCDPDKYREITRVGELTKVIKGLVAAEQAGLKPIKLNCVVSGSSDEPDALGVKAFADNMGYEIRYIHQMNLKQGIFSHVEGGDGGNCSICNRLRLTSDGMIKPCLFSDVAFSIRELGVDQAIKLAMQNKPDKGTVNHWNQFYNIGG